MVTPEVMDQLKDGFGEAVVDCLVNFHHMPRSEAAPKVGKARAILDRGPASPFYRDVIYNDEPFKIANDIARQQLNRENSTKPIYASWIAGSVRRAESS